MGKNCPKVILEALKNGGKKQTIKLTFMFEKNSLCFLISFVYTCQSTLSL